MSKFVEQLPVWNNAGAEPTLEVKDVGWQPKDRPPAAWFNWAWHQTYKCIDEIRKVLDGADSKMQSIPIVSNAGVSGNVFVVPSELTTYVDNMTFNFLAPAHSVNGQMLQFGSLPAKKVVFDLESLQAIKTRTIVKDKIYTISYNEAKDSFVVLNIVRKVETPPMFVGDLNNMQYDGTFVMRATDNNSTNLPTNTNQVQDDIYVVDSILVYDSATQLMMYQIAHSLTSFRTFYRSNIDNGWSTWKQPSGETSLNAININDVFDVSNPLPTFGLDITPSGTGPGPITLTIYPGRVYTQSGIRELRELQQVTFQPIALQNTNVWIDDAGKCFVAISAAATNIATISVNESAQITIQKSGGTVRLKPSLQAVTQPIGTQDKTIATTEFVMSAIGDLEAVEKHNISPLAHQDIRYDVTNAQNTADEALRAITDLTHTIDVLPSQSGSLTYTGSAQSPAWNSYNPAVMTLGGTVSGTNAGSYTATFTPRASYKWWDGTTAAKNVAWSIAKATGSLTISPTSLSLTTASPSKTIAVTRTGDGTITVTSSNTSVATVSLSGTTVTVTAKATGTATITVSVAAGTNHSAPANRTCAVTATMLPTKAALNSMSWADIKEVIDAGQAANYWAVGDRKAVVLNGTVAGFAFGGMTSYCYILGFNHNSSREGANKVHFQFGKTALSGGADVAFISSNYDTSNQSTGFIMNVTPNTNAGGWNSSYMRNTVCAQFKNALSADLQAVLKTVVKWTDNTGGGSDNAGYVTSTTDAIFLLSEFEVHGARTHANSAEQTYQAQYQYYISGNSKVKNQHSATTTAAHWWVRSPHASNNTSFCRVHADGSAGGASAAISRAFAPGFCV